LKLCVFSNYWYMCVHLENVTYLFQFLGKCSFSTATLFEFVLVTVVFCCLIKLPEISVTKIKWYVFLICCSFHYSKFQFIKFVLVWKFCCVLSSSLITSSTNITLDFHTWWMFYFVALLLSLSI
jgi:hypothetical protein